MPKVPGYSGYVVQRHSSANEQVIGKFTDSNHLSTMLQAKPTEYDKMISLFTQTGFYSNDFLNMIDKATPFYIDSNTDQFMWKVGMPYRFNKIIQVPTETQANATPGIDESTFTLVFERPSFQINDIITPDKRFGDALIVVSDPIPVGTGAMYHLKLTGADITPTTSADKSWFTEGQTYFRVDQIAGEFTQNLGGLDNAGQELTLVDSLSAGWGLEHTVTKWADQRTLKDEKGRPLDLITYNKYVIGEDGKPTVVGFKWEPFIDAELRKEMYRIKAERAIWGRGGYSLEKTGKQEVRKHTEGVYHKMKRDGNYIPFQKGTFSLNLLRDALGDLFYRRVDMGKRRAKLFTNEAGIALFRQANKDDLMAMGLTVMVDIKEYGRDPKVVHPGFDMMFSMETGEVEVSHLKELDLPWSQMDFDFNKKSSPIFFIFDITNPNGGLTNNIRTVRQSGAPSMTWGYINGRQHHMGFAASQGMNSASKQPGYTIWYEDREDVFIEDMSRVVIIEEVGGVNLP